MPLVSQSRQAATFIREEIEAPLPSIQPIRAYLDMSAQSKTIFLILEHSLFALTEKDSRSKGLHDVSLLSQKCGGLLDGVIIA